jgi:hypothetical protein
MTPLSRPASSVMAAVLAELALVVFPGHAQRGTPTYPQVQAASVVPEYAAFLSTLDASRPESILKARDVAVADYASAGTSVADAVFRQFWGFYDRVVWNLQRAAYPQTKGGSGVDRLLSRACERAQLRCSPATIDAFLASTATEDGRLKAAHGEAVAFLRRCRAAGVSFFSGEGDWYAGLDPPFVLSVAGRIPVGELKAWAAFWAAEDAQRIAEDAGLVVGWDDLRARLGRWEAFARAHPDLPETQVEVTPHLANLLALYLFGLSNTPAYDARFAATVDYDVRAGAATPALGYRQASRAAPALRIDPRLRSSYDRFVVENRESAYYPLITGIVSRLRERDNAPTKDLADFLKKQLTDPYFDPWLRVTDLWVNPR